MDISLRLVYLVAVLHVLGFGTILCQMDEEWKSCKNDLMIKNFIDSRESFLAGENTPVWYASYSHESDTIKYEKKDDDYVKQAMDFWQLKEVTYENPHECREIVPGIENLITGVNSKRSMNEDAEQVYHPSILIMLDSDVKFGIPVETKKDEDYNKILYVLAYWNAVDLRLRNLRNPHVRLRIAGIIITNSNKTSPYVVHNYDKLFGIYSSGAFDSMMNYWRNMSNTSADKFPISSYDIIATMTSAEIFFFGHQYSKYSREPPCNGSRRDIAGLLLPEDKIFGGIPKAVNALAHMFGGKESKDCPLKEDHVMAETFAEMGRKWSSCTLKQISSTLTANGSCLREAKEFHPPGKPVETILPGMYLKQNEHCKAYGETFSVCRSKTTCSNLWCDKGQGDIECEEFAPTLDGTQCTSSELMCLDEVCSVNPKTYGDYNSNCIGKDVYNLMKSGYIHKCAETDPSSKLTWN